MGIRLLLGVLLRTNPVQTKTVAQSADIGVLRVKNEAATHPGLRIGGA